MGQKIYSANSEIGLSELVSDSQSCLESLISRCEIDKNKVFLLGHNEGALIAIMLAQVYNSAGIILMAPPGHPLDIIIGEQIVKALARANYKSEQIKAQLSEFQKFIDYVRENKLLTFYAPVAFLFNYRSAKWLREHLEHSPSKIVRFVKCPVAIFHGDKDFQLSVEEDGTKVEAKITHIGIGKFKIIDDKNNGKYRYKKIDASDIFSCRIDR